MRPWSTNQLRRLGKRICQSDDAARDVSEYVEVLLWYNDLATQVQQRIAGLDWAPLLGSREIVVSSRAKTVDTLRDKLLRDPATPLQNVQDLAGVRFECEMSLAEQDAVAETIAGVFDHGLDAIHDLRSSPHSGYRALHVWLRLPEGRVEVQVRTRLQGEWANMYESVADVLGRGIRYGDLPGDPTLADAVLQLQLFSTNQIAALEREANDRFDSELAIEDRLRSLGMEQGGADIGADQRRILEIAASHKAVHDAIVERLRALRVELERVGTKGGG